MQDNAGEYSMPRFFSKKAIVLFSIFTSIFFGSLLYAENLREVGKGRHILVIVLLSMVYTFLAGQLLSTVAPEFIILAPVVNLAGAFVLTGPVWKYHFGEYEEYEKRSVKGPLVVVLLIFALILALVAIKGPQAFMK